MTLSKGRSLAARLAHTDLEQTLCSLVDEHKRPQLSGDCETFRLSVQFARAHGVQRAVPGSEITTLSSSALLSGASSR